MVFFQTGYVGVFKVWDKTSSSRTKEGVLAALNKRNDIADQNIVISDFIDRADELIRQMHEDGYNVK